MQQEKSNRSRIIGVRLTGKEYQIIEQRWRSSTCHKLSEYIRRSIFDKPIVATYRNQSLDDFMAELIHLKNELKGIGNNLNQAVKKLHTLHQIVEFKIWITTYQIHKDAVEKKMEEIKSCMNKIADKWLQ